MKIPKYQPGQIVYWLNGGDHINCSTVAYSVTSVKTGIVYYGLNQWGSDFKEERLFESFGEAHRKYVERGNEH